MQRTSCRLRRGTSTLIFGSLDRQAARGDGPYDRRVCALCSEDAQVAAGQSLCAAAKR
jgi:hypothetical protein